MKTITLQVSDDEHKSIKLAATQAGQSIKDFLLASKRELVVETAERVYKASTEQPKQGLQTFIEPTYHSDEETDPGAPETDDQPRTGLESLPKNKIEPIYRNKKKGKL